MLRLQQPSRNAAKHLSTSWKATRFPSRSPSSAPSHTRTFTMTHQRPFTSTSPQESSDQAQKPDWSATQYLKFSTERTRPVYDLLSQVLPHMPSPSSPSTIFDLGCGPGNSSTVLASAFPRAAITGMDASADMLSKARAANIPNASFVAGDLATFAPDADADLVFSNSAFHWLRAPTRLPTLVRLLSGLKPGAVLALQVPDNYHSGTHELMRTVALQEDTPWRASFPTSSTTGIGKLTDATRPDLDPIEPYSEIYNALAPHAASMNIWCTKYVHPLPEPRNVVEWVKSTGLKPFLDCISDEGVKAQFLERYEEKLSEWLVRTVDGKVLLEYPRLFVVAVRK